MDHFDLGGRSALVTGASRGIGAATARALDAAGARVALVARAPDELETVAVELRHDPVVLPADLEEPSRRGQRRPSRPGRPRSRRRPCQQRRHGRPPAHRRHRHSHHRQDIGGQRASALAPYSRPFAVDDRAAERFDNSTFPSVSGVIGTPRRAAYAASKGAIDAATRSLAVELGPLGIRVNSVAPGVVDTALWASNKKIGGVPEAINALTPLRRWADPEDVADVIVFLASDASRFVTGETISADGGMAHALDLYAGPV